MHLRIRNSNLEKVTSQFEFSTSIMTTHVASMSPELSEIARRNCNENAEKLKPNIAALREWIRKTAHLKARTNERLLLAFLRRSQFNLEQAKRRIDEFYSMKNHFPEVLSKRVIDDSLLELMQLGLHIIPQNPINPTGPRLIISRFSKCNLKKFNPKQNFKLFFMLLEILAIEDNNATISGITYIVDARDITLEQMLPYDAFLLKKICMLVEHGLPVKFNEIHFINIRREGQSVFDNVTNCLTAKMPFKFIVHQKAEDLYKHIPRDAMTVEYGGHNGFSCEAVKIWTQKLKDFKKYFAEDDNYGTNEKLRVGFKNRCDINKELDVGLCGSFRKIELD